MQCQGSSSGSSGPPMVAQMQQQQQQAVPMEHFDSSPAAGSQMCTPVGGPSQITSRVPHHHPQMQHAGPPPQPNCYGPQVMPPPSPQTNFDQMMSMLLERQERIKAVMNEPANQPQLPQLKMQLAQNTQEIKNLKQQQQQQQQQQRHNTMFYQGQPMQAGAAPPYSNPGPMMQQPHAGPPPPHGYVEMTGPPHQGMVPPHGHPQGAGMHQPMMNKSQSVAAWQHQNYMLDSGLNSGHSTAPPSLCSNGTGNELLDNEDADSVYSSHASWSGSTPGGGAYPQACYTPEQFDNFNGPRSVGGPMYYESGGHCGETPSYPSPQQFDPNNPPQQVAPNMVVHQGGSNANMQQQMGQPGQQQQMPRQTLKEAISQIAQMLDDSDPVVQLQAAETAQAMAKNPQNRPAIIQSSQMIQNLVNALNSGNEEIVRCAAGTLHDLSQMKPGLLAIFKCGGIQALIGLLQSPREAILFYAITTLHNLLLHQDGAKSAVAMAAGIPILVGLVRKHSNVKFLAITVDCLRSLGYGNQSNKEEILKADGPSTLVKALTSYEYEKLLWTISRVLKVLSVCPQNKQAIVAAGGVQALAFHLNRPANPGGPPTSSTRLVQNCLWTLRNISDVTTQNDNATTELLRKLIPYVRCNDSLMASCAVCILSNLLCNNVNNKIAFVQLQGIQALLFAIDKSQQVEDLVEPALCALRHATSRHQLVAEAQTIIRSGMIGLHCVMKLMDQHMSVGGGTGGAGGSSASSGVGSSTGGPGAGCSSSSTGGSASGSKWPVLKAAVGLLRNMCTSPVNLPDLVQCGTVARLVNVIKCAQTDWQRRAAAGQEYRLDGVKMEDIVEGAIGALHLMASKAQQNAVLFRNAIKSTPNAINIFVQMLGSNSRSVLRVTTSLLSELAIDADGAEMIRHTSNLQPLGGLMDSSDPHIADAANLLFQRLTAHQNPGQTYTTSGASINTGSAASVAVASNFGPQQTTNSVPGGQPVLGINPSSAAQPTEVSNSNFGAAPMEVSSTSSTPAPPPSNLTHAFPPPAPGGSAFSDFGASQSNMGVSGMMQQPQPPIPPFGSAQMNLDYNSLQPSIDMTPLDDFVFDENLFG